MHVSPGVAALRDRLWDSETIISKALVSGGFSLLLAAVYLGLVVGLESLLEAITGQFAQPVVIVISTLAIAALFQPLRHRIQQIIDHRFSRRKYDAEKTLAAFSATLRNEVDLEQLSKHLLAVVQETVQPTHASLWLRSPAHHGTQEVHAEPLLLFPQRMKQERNGDDLSCAHSKESAR